MGKTFQIVRDSIDSDSWRFVTAGNTVWTCVHCDFFSDGAAPPLDELVADNSIQAIECVVTTKAHFDQLMKEAGPPTAPTGG